MGTKLTRVYREIADLLLMKGRQSAGCVSLPLRLTVTDHHNLSFLPSLSLRIFTRFFLFFTCALSLCVSSPTCSNALYRRFGHTQRSHGDLTVSCGSAEESSTEGRGDEEGERCFPVSLPFMICRFQLLVTVFIANDQDNKPASGGGGGQKAPGGIPQ